jgi:hypothetical protein
MQTESAGCFDSAESNDNHPDDWVAYFSGSAETLTPHQIDSYDISDDEEENSTPNSSCSSSATSIHEWMSGTDTTMDDDDDDLGNDYNNENAPDECTFCTRKAQPLN